MPRRACGCSTSPPPRPRAADPQRRGQARAGARDEAEHAGSRAPGRGARGRARRRHQRRHSRRRSRARVSTPSFGALGARRPRQPPLARARRGAARDPPRRRRRPAAGRGTAAAGRAPPADRPQPPPLLHRDLRLRRVPLPLLHGARARPRRSGRRSSPHTGTKQTEPSEARAAPSAREERTARGAAVHALLEWSQANGWREPSEELARRHAVAAGLDPDATDATALLAPVRGWLGSALRERIGPARPRAGGGADPARGRRHRAARLDRPAGRARGRTAAGRRLQDRPPRRRRARPSAPPATRPSARSTPSPSPSPSAPPRSRSPTSSSSAPRSRSLTALGAAEMEAGRERLAHGDRPHRRGEFPVAPVEQRDWALCRGCPALGNSAQALEAV